MEAHGINLKGKLFIEEVAILPTWKSSDERRMLYCSSDLSYYVGTSSGWDKLQTGVASYNSSLVDPTLVLNPTFGSDYLITCTRASGGSIINKNQVQEVIGNDIPRIDWNGGKPGFLIEEQRTNYLLNSDTPVTQSVSLTTGTYTLSVIGSGSCTLSGGPSGTATEGSDITFTLASTTTVTFTVTGSLIRFQCEKGPYSTSYIPTTSAAATRLEDVVNLPISSFWNQNEGTIYCEFIGPKLGSITVSPYIIQIDGGLTTERFMIYVNDATTDILYTSIAAESVIKNVIFGVNIPGKLYKIAITYSLNTQKACSNGGTVSAFGATKLPSGLTTLKIGSQHSNEKQPNTKINKILYYPKFMTDLEIQELTRE